MSSSRRHLTYPFVVLCLSVCHPKTTPHKFWKGWIGDLCSKTYHLKGAARVVLFNALLGSLMKQLSTPFQWLIALKSHDQGQLMHKSERLR